jgi:hypothetical protein
MPIVHVASTLATIVAMPQVIWKFSASTECARTVGDSFPLASSVISGAMKPMMMPPKWARSAQVFSSLVANPAGAGPPGGRP